jgi:hypothetical protein
MVDAGKRALTRMTITPSEKQLEVSLRNGRPVTVAGLNAGVYPARSSDSR